MLHQRVGVHSSIVDPGHHAVQKQQRQQEEEETRHRVIARTQRDRKLFGITGPGVARRRRPHRLVPLRTKPRAPLPPLSTPLLSSQACAAPRAPPGTRWKEQTHAGHAYLPEMMGKSE